MLIHMRPSHAVGLPALPGCGSCALRRHRRHRLHLPARFWAEPAPCGCAAVASAAESGVSAPRTGRHTAAAAPDRVVLRLGREPPEPAAAGSAGIGAASITGTGRSPATLTLFSVTVTGCGTSSRCCRSSYERLRTMACRAGVGSVIAGQTGRRQRLVDTQGSDEPHQQEGAVAGAGQIRLGPSVLGAPRLGGRAGVEDVEQLRRRQRRGLLGRAPWVRRVPSQTARTRALPVGSGRSRSW
jgi:hypothetical protein